MRAKHDYRLAVQEARTVKCNKLEESETACSEAILKNASMRALHCVALCKEHAKHMWELEEWTLATGNKSHHDFLLAHQAILWNAPLSLKEDPHSSYRTLSGQSSSSIQSIQLAKTPQMESQPSTHTSPKWSQWLERWDPSPDLQGDRSVEEDSPMGLQEDPPHSKRGKTSDWPSSLKPSHVDAFSRDSSPVKEVREHYFATHPYNWVHSNVDNLSDIFRELTLGTGLLGVSIYEIQQSWDGPEDLKHANYALQSLPKGLKFLRAVSTQESPKVMGLKGIQDPDALQQFASYTYCPWCGKMDRMREQSSIT